jgi:DME family drug/metabolite transporter
VGWVRGRRSGSRPGAAELTATGLALLGLGLLIGLPAGRFSPTAVLASAGMAVLAASGFAAMTLIGTRPVPGLDDLTVTGFGFTIGGGVLLVVAAAAGHAAFTPRPAAIGLLIALGTGPTAVAYTADFRGLRSSTAGTAALLALLEPLTGTVLAVLLLGDRLSLTSIAGAVILGVAVGIGCRARAPVEVAPDL